MRVLMFSAHDTAPDEAVHSLAVGLARAGHGVDLIAPEQPSLDADAHEQRLRIARVPEYPPMVPASDRLAWAIQLSAGMLERATRLAASAAFDIIHAHGWETAWAAAAAKAVLAAPMVSTLTSCEHGRAGHDLDETGRLVAQAEWWLTYESRKTIVPDHVVRAQIESAFELPTDKQVVISDGSVEETVETYARAVADEAELRRRGEDRPPLRVILGRSSIARG
ncbi:MAG TPA: glycosyltransferase family 4 protein [Actinomycetota bacterium]|nr:glycosyltransferase family 4 protein [Actinomycetota bacterium]